MRYALCPLIQSVPALQAYEQSVSFAQLMPELVMLYGSKIHPVIFMPVHRPPSVIWSAAQTQVFRPEGISQPPQGKDYISIELRV